MAIPSGWMPDVPMKRVICHWTAGAHQAGDTDRECYHILIEGDGRLVRGDPSITQNSGRIKKGYAAHTRNCNSGSIGVSICCMKGARDAPFSSGRHPMTKAQWDTLVVVVAELCKRYRIKITPKTVLSHAEVETNLGIEQQGKWDISRLSFDRSVVGARACGDRLRADVMASTGTLPDIPPVSRRPVSRGKETLEDLLAELVEIIVRALVTGLKTLVRELLKKFK